MAWRGESWADIVARAAKATPRRHAAPEVEDRAALAARAQRWEFPIGRLELGERAITLGTGMSSVEVPLSRLYHVEPVDPWPSLALGWLERGESYSTVLTPLDADCDAFAALVEELVIGRASQLSAALPGWLSVPIVHWDTVGALPGEREEGPAMRGYRLAPQLADPVIARRITEPGGGRLLTWMWAGLRRSPRRIEPREAVLTQRFVYARTRGGERLRVDAGTLRTARRTLDGDAVFVFGRNTELLLVHQGGCPLEAALHERIRER